MQVVPGFVSRKRIERWQRLGAKKAVKQLKQ